MPTVFVADELAPEGIAALESYPELVIDFSPGLDVATACEHAAAADAIIVRSATKIRGELLAAATRLKVVGRAGIGVDNIDLDAATERGVVVLNTPDANATTTAELALAHMFSLSRSLPAADESVRAGRWERSKFLGSELSGKTVGVIGFGTIGRIVADRCQGLRMTVLGHDPFVTPETFSERGVEACELDALLARADYVTLHCPLVDGTRGLLSAARLKGMKQGARVINCARGGLIDEAALAEAVASGHLAGAALDVFETEPPGESPLIADRRIQFTPHLGASTFEAQTAVGVEIAHQIAAFLLNGEIRNSVNTPSLAPEKLAQLGPYLALAQRLGRLLGLMSEGPIESVELGLYGHAAALEPAPLIAETLIGVLCEHLSIPMNHVNAVPLARRQGIQISETRSTESRDYVTSVRVTGTYGETTLCLEGTLFDERDPRLVRVNDYEIEAALDGFLVVTRHHDRPGVIGAIGDLLGREGINISRMQVGTAGGKDQAIAVLTVSKLLDEGGLGELAAIDPINKVLQVDFECS